MTAKTIAGVIAAHLEHEGDRYNFSNSASIKVLGLDLQEALTAAGFGLVADAGAKALEDAAEALKEAREYIDPWGKPTYQNYADWLRARAAAVRGEG